MNTLHTPVLLDSVLEVLNPRPGDRILDATLGLGGHASALLKRAGPKGVLVALDADERNIALAEPHLRKKNVTLVHANFGNIPRCLPDSETQFDVILADLGISSVHLDDPERGFTFRADAPLDMRLDPSQVMTAAKIIKHYSDDGLMRLFREEGELSRPDILVRCIRKIEKEKPLERSLDLNAAVESAYGYKAPRVLPQVYQALRMAVNREREMLAQFVEATPHLLAPGGRLGIISFHSLEDRIVKQAFRSLTLPTKDELTGQITREADYETITKKPIVPSDKEIRDNPRSRSAKFRALRRRML
ncbi:MAG: 16S rRNA (cytosine(1402)-N(4))-methyltransferase RsmH [Candidatus Peribacteraceae bacterium]